MSKYTKEFKLQIIHDYDSLSLGYTTLSKKYDVHRSIIMRWIYGYQCHGPDYFEKRSFVYSPEFKLSVLTHMNDHHISPKRAAAFFGMPSFTVIMQWQSLYNSGGASALVAKPRERSKMPKSKPK